MVQAQIHCSDEGRASLPSILSAKSQRAILMFANQVVCRTSDNFGLSDVPLTFPAVFFAGESADSSPVGLWSEKLGQSRWSLPEHTIRLSWRCPFWSPPLHPTPPSIWAGAWW